MNAFNNFGYSMQIFQVRPVELILASFFWNFLISLPLWVFTSWLLYPIKMLKKYSIFQLFILKQVYGHRFLSILLLPHFGTQSSHLCASLAGCWDPLVLDLLNLGPVLLYLLSGLDIFLFLWVITVISPDSHDASRKKYLPTTSRNSYGVTSEPQVTATEGSFGGSLVWANSLIL